MPRIFSPKSLLLWQKLVLVSGIFLTLLAGGLIGANYWTMHRVTLDIGKESQSILEETTRRFLGAIVSGQAATIDHQLEQAKNAARIAARTFEDALWGGHNPHKSVLHDILDNSGPYATAIYYLPEEGPPIVFTREAINSIPMADLPLETLNALPDLETNHAEDLVAWSKVHPNPFSKAYDRVIDAVAPVHNNREKIGIIGISVSVIRMGAQFNHRQAIRGSYTFMINSQRSMLAFPPLAIGELISPAQASTRTLPSLATSENPALHFALHTMAFGNQAVESVTFSTGKKYLAFHPLVNADMRLGLVVPERQAAITTTQLTGTIKERSRTAIFEMSVLALFLLGMTLIGVAYISRTMSRPLLKITAAANQISKGAIRQVIPVSGNDEIGELATSFNSMSQRLNDFIDDLNNQQKMLTESETRYRQLFESSPVSLLEEDFSLLKRAIDDLKAQGVSDFETYFDENEEEGWKLLNYIHIVDVNKATLQLLEAESKEQLIGNLAQILSLTPFSVIKEELLSIADDRMFEFETVNRTMSGKKLNVVVRSSIRPGYENTWEKVLISMFDITERKQLEEEKLRLETRLQQAYKMEAIGTLAGGIAHDFNNILTAIIGYTELIKIGISPDSPVTRSVERILQASQRARELVSQILTFSRRTATEVKAVSLQQISIEATQLLRASFPTTITIEQQLHTDGIVMADAGQLHQVLINLCTNASLAMEEDGGTMSILLEELPGHAIEEAAEDGNGEETYIHLKISDTGCGMEPEIIDRMFEPFFTTRPKMKGTGMGLAVVHGIITSLGGYLQVTSTPGKGTAISIFLVKSENKPEHEPASTKASTHQPTTKSILFVDDEVALTDMVEQMLKALEYKVETFNSPSEALRRFEQSPHLFELVISDFTMPEMTGDKLARHIRSVAPSIPILICTGYNELQNIGVENSTPADSLAQLGITGMFNKPFTSSELKKHIDAALTKSSDATQPLV